MLNAKGSFPPDFGTPPPGTRRQFFGESDSSLSSRETCLRGAQERRTETELINFQIRHVCSGTAACSRVPRKGREGGGDKDS